jgi:PTS system nitrogen regulatory IIA component
MDNIKKKYVRISDYLKGNNILFFPADFPKEKIFEQLIGTLEVPDAGLALKAILDREQWGSTVIAPGLALPHARIPGIARIVAALGICPSQIFLLFLGSPHNMQEHLAFLAGVSSLFQTKGFLDQIVSLKTSESVLARIRRLEG